MKKIGKFIKSNTKLLVGIILGAAVSGGAVYAATVLPSSQVGYDNSTSGLAATDVQGALDELYQKTRNLYPMQGFDKSMLSATGASAKVYDKRDGNIYTVKKLADGNVWMTENLRIANKTISDADSNLPSGTSYTIPVSDLSNFTTDQNTNAAYIDSTYGGYYNFYTATAGTGGTSLTSGNAPSSICPKGWRLPTGDSSGEFNTLYGQYNSTALMMDVPNFTLSGEVYDGSVHPHDSSFGPFWSSTVYNARYANYLSLSINSSDTNPATTYNKIHGYSVRCIAI